MIITNQYQDITCGHRISNGENFQNNLHRFRINFTFQSKVLTSDANKINFSIAISRLCDWVEKQWDNKFLCQDNDNLVNTILGTHMPELNKNEIQDLFEFFVPLPFDPTAEKLAVYLLDFIGPEQLKGTDIELTKVSLCSDMGFYGYAKLDEK